MASVLDSDPYLAVLREALERVQLVRYEGLRRPDASRRHSQARKKEARKKERSVRTEDIGTKDDDEKQIHLKRVQETIHVKHSTNSPAIGADAVDMDMTRAHAVVDLLGEPEPWPRLDPQRFRLFRVVDDQVVSCVKDQTDASNPYRISARHLQTQQHHLQSIDQRDRSDTAADAADTKHEFVPPFAEDLRRTDDPRNINGLLRSFDEVCRRLTRYAQYKHLQADADKERGAVSLKTNAPSRSIMAQTHSSQVKTLFENSSAPMVLVASLRGFDVGHAPTPLSRGKKQNSLFAAFKDHRQTFNTPFLKASGDTRIGFTTSKLNIPRSLRAADPQFPSTAQEIMRYLIKNNIHMQSLLMDCFWIFFLEFFALSSLSVRYLRFRKLIREEHDALERSAAVRQELGMPTDGGRAHRFQRERATEQIRKRLHEYGSGLVTADFLSEQRLADYNAILNSIKRPDDIEYVDLATLVGGGGGGEPNSKGGASSVVDTDAASRIGMAKISVSRSLAKDIVAKATRKPRPEELMTVRGAFLGDGYINETRGLELVAGGGGEKGGSSGSMPIATLSRARRMVPFHLLTHCQLINATLPSGADAVVTATNSSIAGPHQQRSPPMSSVRTINSNRESARNPRPCAVLADVHRAPKPPLPRHGGLPTPRCRAKEIFLGVEISAAEINTLVELPQPVAASNTVPHALSPAAVSYTNSKGFESDANGTSTSTLGLHFIALSSGGQLSSPRPQSSPKVPFRLLSVAPSTPAPLRPPTTATGTATTTTTARIERSRPLFTPCKNTPDKDKSSSPQEKRHTGDEGVMVEVRARSALPIVTANSPRVRSEEKTCTKNKETHHHSDSTPLTRLLTPWSGSRQHQSQGLVESPSIKEGQPNRPLNGLTYKNIARGSSAATARPHTSPAIGTPPLSARTRTNVFSAVPLATDASPRPPTAPKPSLYSATISSSRLHDDGVDDKILHDKGIAVKDNKGRPATAAKAHEGDRSRHQGAPTPLYSPRTFQRTAAIDSAFPAPEDYHTKHYLVEMRKRATGLGEHSTTTSGHDRGSGGGPSETTEDPSANPRVIVVQNVPERDDRSGEWRNRQIAPLSSALSLTHEEEEEEQSVPLLTLNDYSTGTLMMMIDSQKEENGTTASSACINSAELAVVSDQAVGKERKEQQRAPCIIQTNYCSEVDPSQCLRVLDEFFSATKSYDEKRNPEKDSSAVAIEAPGKEGAEVGFNAMDNGSPFFSIGRTGRLGVENANPLGIANGVTSSVGHQQVDNVHAHRTVNPNKNIIVISNSRRTSSTSSKGQLSSKELAESIIAEIRGPKIEVCPHHEIEARELEVRTNELRDKIVAAHEGGDLVDLEITSCGNNDDERVSPNPPDDRGVGGDIGESDATTARLAFDVPQLTALAIEVVREEQDMLFSRISHHLQRLFAFGRFSVSRNISDGPGVKGKERHDYHHQDDSNDDNAVDAGLYNTKMRRRAGDGTKGTSSTSSSSSELSESDGWSDLLDEILEEEENGDDGDNTNSSGEDEERDKEKESEGGGERKKLSFSSNEALTGGVGVGGDDDDGTSLRVRKGPLTTAILRRSVAIERAKEARHAAKERRLAAIAAGKRRPHSVSPSSPPTTRKITFTTAGTEDEVSINASPALREVKAQLLSPLPDILAHMVWLELRHWMPYAEDLLGNNQRAEIKRRLSVWIHGIENTQTSHWDVDESDLAEAKQKLSRLREMRREASKAFGGRASSTATALQFMFSHAPTAPGATATSSSSNKPKREDESSIADDEKKDPKKEIRRGFVMVGNAAPGVEEEGVTVRGRKKREILRGLDQDKLEQPAEVSEKAPAEALQPGESVGELGLGGAEGATTCIPQPPPILFKLFDDGDNLPPPPTAEQKAAMLKHKVIDPVCAVSCDHTLRELNAMRLGEGGAAEIEELAREEEAERQRKARLRARYRQAALQQQSLNRGRSSSGGGNRRSSLLAGASQQNNGPDAKDILRLHRFSPANRAPRQWHERGKKPTHDLGAIMKAAPLLSSAAPAFFDVRQTSPLMRRFLTDGNAELPNTKRSNTLAWSQ